MRNVSYNHPKYHEIKEHCMRRFNSEFNSIPLDVVEKYYDHELHDYIEQPSIFIMRKEWWNSVVAEKQKEIEEQYNLDYGMLYPDDRPYESFEHYLEEEYYNEIMDYFYNEHYPMWGTVFEAKDSYVNDVVKENIDSLYEIGIVVIYEKGNLNCMLFINGAGYDFYEAHWIPMMIYFGWVPYDLLEDGKDFESKEKQHG